MAFILSEKKMYIFFQDERNLLHVIYNFSNLDDFSLTNTCPLFLIYEEHSKAVLSIKKTVIYV